MRSSLLLCSLLGGTWLARPASGQRYAKRFNFLTLNSDEIWGGHLRGPPNKDYNEWNEQAPLCNDLYQGYLTALEIRDRHIGDYIYNVSKCILDSSSSFQTQTIQASSVLLGLAPILLSTTGPTLTELALISVQRPVLAVLFSLATAAVFPSRVLSFYDDLPRQVINRSGPSRRLLQKSLYPDSKELGRKRRLHLVIGLLEYALAIGSVFNTLYTSWQLGIGTISVLDCTASWFPLLWCLLPLLIHALVCGAFHLDLAARSRYGENTSPHTLDGTDLARSDHSLSQDRDSRPPVQSSNPQEIRAAVQTSVSPNHDQETADAKDWEPGRLELHILPSYAHERIPADVLDSPSLLVDLAHKLGTILALVQVIGGVIIFSALLFITVADAAAILLRFLASVVMCRVLIAIELGGIKAESIQEKEMDER